jgi:pseudomonalisin
LTALIDSIHGLTDVPVTPMSLRSGPQRRSAGGATSGLSPELTVTSNGVTSHLITPNDFATIFDINSVYSGGNKGATIGSKAQHIAIIGRSRVAASDIAEYAANVGISGYSVNTVIPTTGVDPGAVCTFANARTCATGGDQSEQTLDVSRVIGTAPGVQADLVVSGKLNGADGVDIGVAYNVNTLVDPVMTISYSSCEALSGSAGVTFWDTLFSAGAAEGISTFVSSGDSGVSGCAPAGSATGTVYPASINAICASSYVTCVGGTALYDYVSNSPYWSATNGGGLESALSYIPEVAWNEPGSIGPYQIAASGGGPSLFIGKPSWQSGTGVPPDGHRDTPDVSFPSAGHDAYYVCLDFALGAYVSQGVTVADTCANGYFFSFFGTSAAAPAMASVAALLNTRVGIVQGNLDSLLYRLASAAAGTSVFHDTTIPASLLGCVVINASSCNNSTPGRDTTYTTDLGGVQGYLLTTGYDEVTGLGSIDVGNLLSAAAASAPSFVLAPVYSGLTLISGTSSGNTDTITVASVNGFAGSVNLTCSVTTVSGTAAGSCSMLPAAVTLSNSSSLATLTIATVFGTSGTLSVTVMGTSGTLSASSAVISVTLQAVAINLSTPAALNDSGATTGNVTQMILTSVNGFSGPVTLACTISTGTESFPPTCVFDPPSLSLAANGLNSVAISFGSTKVQVKSGGPQQAGFGWLGMGVSALVYAWMLCLPRFRRRQGLGSLLAFALLAVGLPVVYGCGGGSGSSVGGTVHGSSAGIYVVSVTAQGTTPGGATVAASTSFPLTIQ